jgi:hypothetical protein
MAMKKLILFGSTLIILSLSSSIQVNSQQADNTATTAQITALDMPPSVIDGIEVPNDVVMSIQMEYPGHAVTKAAKVSRGETTLYQLTVDQDDQLYNNKLIYVFYDMNWEWLRDERFTPTQIEAKPQKEEKKDEEKPEDRGDGFLDEGVEPTNPDEDNSGEDQDDEEEPPEEPPVEDAPPEETEPTQPIQP